jgi:hypothetical protein
MLTDNIQAFTATHLHAPKLKTIVLFPAHQTPIWDFSTIHPQCGIPISVGMYFGK